MNKQEEREIYKYINFVFGGIAISGLELLITFTFTEVFNLWYIASYAIALIIGGLLLFNYYRKVTFHHIIIPDKGLFYFMSMLSIIYLANLCMVFTLSRFSEYLIALYNLKSNLILHYHYLAVIIMVAIPLSMANFRLNRRYIFTRSKKTRLF